MDSTFKELFAVQCTKVKAWHLATSLGAIVFQDFAETRNGMPISVRVMRHEKVASLIRHGSLRSLDAMNSHKESNFSNHPSVEEKFFKFLTTNSPFNELHSMHEETSCAKEDFKDFNKDLPGSRRKPRLL